MAFDLREPALRSYLGSSPSAWMPGGAGRPSADWRAGSWSAPCPLAVEMSGLARPCRPPSTGATSWRAPWPRRMPTHDPRPAVAARRMSCAPRGVIGGYLTMIERQPLALDQSAGPDGARRAQRRVIESSTTSAGCSSLRRRTRSRAAPAARRRAGAASPAAAPTSTSSSRAPCTRMPMLGVAADRDALVRAMTTFALTVAREHGTGRDRDVTPRRPAGARMPSRC